MLQGGFWSHTIGTSGVNIHVMQVFLRTHTNSHSHSQSFFFFFFGGSGGGGGFLRQGFFV